VVDTDNGECDQCVWILRILSSRTLVDDSRVMRMQALSICLCDDVKKNEVNHFLMFVLVDLNILDRNIRFHEL